MRTVCTIAAWLGEHPGATVEAVAGVYATGGECEVRLDDGTPVDVPPFLVGLALRELVERGRVSSHTGRDGLRRYYAAAPPGGPHHGPCAA